MILLPVNDVDKVNERVVKSEILCSKKPSSCVVSEVYTQKKEYTKEIIQKKENVFLSKPSNDPFIPTHDFDGANIVHKILAENLRDQYESGMVSDPAHCNSIYSLLISDDKETELKEKLIQYEFTWWAEKEKQPNAKNVFKAWDTLSASKVPKWYRDGFDSHEDALKAIQRSPVTRTSAVPERFTPAESDIVNFEAEMRALKGELETTPI
jgi:hypothetical protein